MNKSRLSAALLIAISLMVSACSTLPAGAEISTLQKHMQANHQAALVIFEKMNDEDRPYRIRDAVNRGTFSAQDLNTLEPTDIQAWDKVLSALDAYCDGLAALGSGAQAADFVSASEALGGKIKSLGQAAKFSLGSHAYVIGTAVTALGSILIQVKADDDIHKVAVRADDDFAKVAGGLIATLGFDENSLARTNHGMLAAYEVHFASGHAPQAKRFREGSIAGYAVLSPAERREAINAFIAWQKEEANHDTFVEAATTLAGALKDAIKTHHAVATGDKPSLSAMFAILQTEIKEVQDIYKNFSKK